MLTVLAATLVLQVAPPAAAPPQRADSQPRPDSLPRAVSVADSALAARRARAAARRIPVTPALERSAFADTLSRAVIRRARAARMRQDSLLRSYDAKTYQRMSVNMAFRALVRDRLALRTESAARVRWLRGSGLHVEVTGARSAAPIAGAEMSSDGFGSIPIPYFPGRESLFPMSMFQTVRAEIDVSQFIHPLAEGAEAYYKYRAGGTMTLVLPNRERITLRELEITARRPQWKLFVGSFWFDDASGQLVRAAYRMSEPLDIWQLVREEERNDGPDDDDDVPLAVRAMLNPATLDISAMTTEYELREGRFWMPRANYLEGMMRMGFVRTPVKMEERFEYSSINGLDSLPTLQFAGRDTAARRDSAGRLERDADEAEINITIGNSRGDTLTRRDSIGRVVIVDEAGPGDSARLARRARRAQREQERKAQCEASGSYVRMQSRFDGALRYPISVPCDSARLTHSPDLPKSIYDEGEELFDVKSRDELLKALDFGLQPSLTGTPVKPYWSIDLLRYNRVEGLSSAVGARWAPGGGWGVDGRVRLGIADLEPNADLQVTRSNARSVMGIGAYRRLVAANDRGDPLGFGASLATVLYGRDEGFYWRTAGVELTGIRGAVGNVRWRLFAEDHSTADKETDWSLAKTFAGDDLLPNIEAREGFVTGAATTVAFTRGLDPRGWRLAGDWRAEGAFGDFDYARTALDATLSRGLGRKFEGAITAAGGYSGGDLPPQRLWYVGGAHTVRGQTAGTMAGDAYWLGRLELARSWPAVRPVVFGDVGWAGDRDRLFDAPGRVMSGAGIGASFLDGLMRVDLSRGIRPREQFRLALYLEARF